MPNRRQALVAPLALALSSWLRPAAARAAPGVAPLLTVTGRVLARQDRADRSEFDMATLERLPQRVIVTSTPWYPSARQFTGPLLRDVLAAAGLPAETDATLRCVALNDYKVDIPVGDARRIDVILARLLDGKPMSVREKGPLFVMYPFDEQPALRTSLFFGRCIWQLKAIEVL
jgi:hypothetical protein